MFNIAYRIEIWFFPTVGINIVILGTTVYILTSTQTRRRKQFYFLAIVL